jgi:hypothetical protein
MNILTSMTAILPTILIIGLANNSMRLAPRSRQLRLGATLLVIVLLPIVGTATLIPGGAFSDTPQELRPYVDHMLYLAISPVIGTFFFAILMLVRGIRTPSEAPVSSSRNGS